MSGGGCPSCGEALSIEFFEGHYGARVELDLCHACELIWFDKMENIRLSSAGVLALMRAMAADLDPQRRTLPERLPCPRCRRPLPAGSRPTKHGPVPIHKCRKDHGFLMTYFAFLRERDCIRPLTGKRLEELRAQVEQIRCSGCGASVKLRDDPRCCHCGAVVSILDREALAETLGGLQADADRRANPNADQVAADLVMERLRTETSFRAMDSIYRERAVSQGGLGIVEVGLRWLARALS